MSHGICMVLLNFHVFAHLVLASDKGTNMAYFGRAHSALVEIIVPWNMTGTQALTGEILKILNLSHETISVYLVDWLYLSVEFTDNKYCIFGRVQGP